MTTIEKIRLTIHDVEQLFEKLEVAFAAVEDAKVKVVSMFKALDALNEELEEIPDEEEELH